MTVCSTKTREKEDNGSNMNEDDIVNRSEMMSVYATVRDRIPERGKPDEREGDKDIMDESNEHLRVSRRGLPLLNLCQLLLLLLRLYLNQRIVHQEMIGHATKRRQTAIVTRQQRL